MKRTKIICTIGPASNNAEILEKIILAGMDVARLNFSHGNAEQHGANIGRIKAARQKTGRHIAILLDTKGPEIRTGDFEDGEIILKEGQEFTLKSGDFKGTEKACSISYEDLYKYVAPGSRILIDDGLVEMSVKAVDGTDIQCEVLNPGIVKNKKGVNVPGVRTDLPAVSEKDYNDILFGIESDVDFIAASFVRTAADVKEIRKILEENNGRHIRIISKIENAEGVDNIDEIIAISDGIMVARGDLGVEVPIEAVPLIQKKIISKCNFAGKPVITATQMLDSMMRNPRPTRAEVADVANAILDGTDAVMLSGETAAGKYPVESVAQMREIAIAAEAELNYEALLYDRSRIKDTGVTDAIGYATCASAQGLKAEAILTPTTSGYTPTVVSKFRPKAPIIATMSSERVARRLSLNWNVFPLVIEYRDTTTESIELSVREAVAAGHIGIHDLIIITAGVPTGIEGNTNMMRVHIVGREI